MDADPGEQAAPRFQSPDEYNSTKKGKFRFKSSKSSHRSEHRHRHRHRSRHDDGDDRHHHRSHDSRHDRHHYHRSKRHRKNPTPPPRETDPDPDPDLNANASRLSPNAAFRESLFDALADDEGADYWQAVYGQPIHTYTDPGVSRGAGDELEHMTDEEYASYVRTRMWERTREGMLEMQERERRERRERARRERTYEEDVRERVRFEKAVEESLARGAGRRKVRVWRDRGKEYLGRWGVLDGLLRGDAGYAGDAGGYAEGKRLGDLIFWPVESGKRRDVSKEAVGEFLRNALVSESGSGSGSGSDSQSKVDLPGVLKTERVRWHPDKIQHRYGSLGIDEDAMRSVTEVFQIIDHMWNEEKK